jgi:hypothetical protein
MTRWCAPYLLAALLLFPNPVAAQNNGPFILETGQSYNLYFPSGTTHYIRWDGGTATVHTPDSYPYTLDGPSNTTNFVCYAAVIGNTTSNVLCGIGRGPVGATHSNIRFATPTSGSVTYAWEPTQGQQYIVAIVRLTGGQPQFIPTTGGSYADTPTAATCYAVLKTDYSLYAQPACAVPGSAMTFSSLRAAGGRALRLPPR